MDSDKDYTSFSLAVVDAPFAGKPLESPIEHGLIDSLVPDPTCLLHPIEPLAQFSNPILFTGLLKALRLLHILDLVLIEYAIEKCGLDIKLLSVIIICCSK
jgi:hypothetical protein